MSVPPKKRLCRALAALSQDNWKNQRNNDAIALVSNDRDAIALVSSERSTRLSGNGRSNRPKRLLDLVATLPDETVARVIGHTEVVPSPATDVTAVAFAPNATSAARIATNTTSTATSTITTCVAPTDTLARSLEGDFQRTDKTPVPLLDDRLVSDGTHVLLPWLGLQEFVEENFVCRYCKKQTNTSVFERLQMGFATSLNYYCSNDKCLHVSKVGGETKETLSKDLRTKNNYVLQENEEIIPRRLAVRHYLTDYSVNVKSILAMQQLGHGQAGASVVGASLGLVPNSMAFDWTSLEERIGVVQIALGRDIIAENILKEKALSKKTTEGLYLFSVGIDGAWNNRGSGKSYNSDSGHHFTVGNESGLVVGMQYFSKRCEKCERNITHEKEFCSRNYVGSSKGMEATGAIKTLKYLHLNHQIIYEFVVMDDDSSSENIMRWNSKAALDAGLITCLPTTPAGNEKKSTGQLPLTHPEWTKLADPNHRMRCQVGKIYNQAKAKKDVSLCTTADAERLKRNLSYAVHEYKLVKFPTFKKMVWSVLYHHFGKHDTCDVRWCRALQHKENPVELKKLHYRCCEKDAWLYQQMLDIWNTYCTDAALRQLHHKWHTNKCESLNQFVTKFIRKSEHLCRTIVGHARTMLAVGLASIGYEAYYRTLYNLLGVSYDEVILLVHHQQKDARKKYNNTRDNKPEVRMKKAQVRAIRIRENIIKTMGDKKAGKSYETGHGGPQKTEAETTTKRTAKKKDMTKQCKHCHLFGHQKRSSKLCGQTTYKAKGTNGLFVNVVRAVLI
jgi:hypothetical protein